MYYGEASERMRHIFHNQRKCHQLPQWFSVTLIEKHSKEKPERYSYRLATSINEIKYSNLTYLKC